MGSEHEDYLMRQFRILAIMLARIIGLRAGGRTEEARDELDGAYGLLLGPRKDLLRMVDPRTAAALLGSPEEILMLARLTSEEAALATEPGDRDGLRLRAVELALEAVGPDRANDEVVAFLAGLAPLVDAGRLDWRQREVLAALAARHGQRPETPQDVSDRPPSPADPE